MESVTFVRPRDDFHLELKFSTGEVGLFDMTPYLDKGVFRRLQDLALFKQAYVAFDTVCWPGNLDMAPETLYDRSRSKDGSSLAAADRTLYPNSSR
jgi:hypothetical protein